MSQDAPAEIAASLERIANVLEDPACVLSALVRTALALETMADAVVRLTLMRTSELGKIQKTLDGISTMIENNSR